MAIQVVQGERELVDQNRSLARFELRGIPPMAAGAARIKVTFSVDADGLLTVSASEETTGIEAEVAVKPTYGLNEEEMASMLYDSLKNAQGDMQTRMLAEARVEAERSYNAAVSALAVDGDLLDVDGRAAIDSAMAALRIAIDGSDRDAINGAVEALEATALPFAEKRMDKGIRAALAGHTVDEFAT